LAVAQSVFNADVIHCHDWPTGTLPVVLAEHLHAQPGLMGLKTVFTIHNLGYQGPVPLQQAKALGFNGTFRRAHASMLRGGLETADCLTTVSPTYSREICKPEFGCGLDSVLSRRSNVLHGIINGIDTEVWDPATDLHLPANFSLGELAGKQVCKAALLKEFGLPADRIDKPLIGIVSRFANQKGLDLLGQNPLQFLDLDASLVVIGDGNPQEEDFFRWLAVAHPTRVGVKIGYNAGVSHRIIGGADAFLMPSRYEPCGLTQLYAMRYGTLPIVHETGGLKDTVNAENGFSFRTHTWRSLYACLREMVNTWRTTKWGMMQNKGMSADYSWHNSAAEYARLYDALNQKRQDSHL
jgi:starch synthase